MGKAIQKVIAAVLSAVIVILQIPNISVNVSALNGFSVDTESFSESEYLYEGKEVNICASASGGNIGENDLYLYKFEYYPVKDNGRWITISNFSTISDIDFAFDEAGKYYFRISAKDSKGNTVSNNYAVYVYKANVNTTSVSSENITTDQTLIIHPSFETYIPENVDGHVYYRYKQDIQSDSYWKEFYTQDFDDIEIKFPCSGTYELEVTPYQNNGSLMESKKFTVNVTEPFCIKAEISGDTAVSGDSIYVKVAAQGGKAPYQYACYYRKKNAEKWTTKANFGTVCDFKITFSGIGEYEICVKAKDNTGTIVKKYFVCTIKAPLVNDSVLSAENIILGEKITAKGIASGGIAPYQYQVLYKQTTQTKWTSAQTFSTNATVTFKPAKAVEYDVCVKVKDKTNKIVKKFFKVNVSSPLKNHSVISADSVRLGDSFKATAAATGGTTPYTYAFYYKQKTQTKWTAKQGFKENSAVYIKPAKAVEYDVCVKVKDSSGTVAKKYFTVKVSR